MRYETYMLLIHLPRLSELHVAYDMLLVDLALLTIFFQQGTFCTKILHISTFQQYEDYSALRAFSALRIRKVG